MDNIVIFIIICIILYIIYYIINVFNIHTHIYACRKPNTKIGSWHGAYVFVKDIYGNMIMAIFEDGKDFIGYPKSIVHGKEIYNNYINDHNWIKMSNDDIYKTSGIKVSYFTKTDL